jgi:hypothetical protein
MNKFVSTAIPSFRFDAERKGAKYSLDNGEHWLNGGEFAEAALKSAMGFSPCKDANTAFDAGSDIPELNMSVKSSKATLTSEVLGKDMDTSLTTYFERTASTSWAWVIVTDETVTAYIMNAEEFERFTREWATYNTEHRIRYKVTSGKMVKWFEERV